MFEHCGVIGIYCLKGKNVVPMILTSLEALQHRGQESWGIVIPHSPPYKKMDIVSLMNDVAFSARAIPMDQLCLSCTTGDYSCLKYKPRFRKREEMKA